jgi:uncharacterized protein (UPF0335 family)
MPKKKGKTVSFDAMVKFFMQQYNVPTKKDVEKLVERMDRIEKLLRSGALSSRGRRQAGTAGARGASSASDQVLEIIQQSSATGAGFAEIKEKTGFDDKKLRNIIFRLSKTERIHRKSRGVYTSV